MIASREQAEAFLDQLERGERRAVRRSELGEWMVDREVKEQILQVFRWSHAKSLQATPFTFRDRDLLFPREHLPDSVRVVPGGTTVRRGASIAADVVIMPPSYINVGASIDTGSMIDSHVLVGSCAQIGKRVHLSAGVQIGGVLEPIGALPVIVEDDAFLGGLSGVFEGVRVGAQAILAAGVILTASKPVFDVVHARRIEPVGGVLAIPPRAVVVSGTRSLSSPFARQHDLSADVALIVKYRDPATEARIALEDSLRETGAVR